jgi:hypothetical protein
MVRAPAEPMMLVTFLVLVVLVLVMVVVVVVVVIVVMPSILQLYHSHLRTQVG